MFEKSTKFVFQKQKRVAGFIYGAANVEVVGRGRFEQGIDGGNRKYV